MFCGGVRSNCDEDCAGSAAVRSIATPTPSKPHLPAPAAPVLVEPGQFYRRPPTSLANRMPWGSTWHNLGSGGRRDNTASGQLCVRRCAQHEDRAARRCARLWTAYLAVPTYPRSPPAATPVPACGHEKDSRHFPVPTHPGGGAAPAGRCGQPLASPRTSTRPAGTSTAARRYWCCGERPDGGRRIEQRWVSIESIDSLP